MYTGVHIVELEDLIASMINLLKCNLKTTSNKQAQLYRELLTELKSLITTLKVEKLKTSVATVGATTRIAQPPPKIKPGKPNIIIPSTLII